MRKHRQVAGFLKRKKLQKTLGKRVPQNMETGEANDKYSDFSGSGGFLDCAQPLGLTAYGHTNLNVEKL